MFRGDKVNIVSVGITPLPLLLAILATLEPARQQASGYRAAPRTVKELGYSLGLTKQLLV